MNDLVPWAPAFGLLLIGALILASQVFRKNPFSVGLLISALLWVWLRPATDIFDGTEKWIALYAQYVALAFLPPFWIGTCISFTGRAVRAARGILAALISAAIFFAAIIITSPLTGVFFRSVVLAPGERLFMRVPGAAYYALMAFLFASIGAGTAYLIKNAKELSALDRRRAIIILIAVLAPIAAGLADLFRVFPKQDVSFASLAILFSVAALMYGVASSRLMSPIPLVHRTLVDEMTEPVLACDDKSRVIYANPAALAISPGGAIPQRAPLKTIFPEITIPEEGEGPGEGIGIHIRGEEFRVSVKRIADEKSETGTMVLVLHDVTRIVAEKVRLAELVAERTSLLNDANLALEIEIDKYRTSQIELEKLIRQKEALLKEVNHRVKNNLQIIASLLKLQDRRLEESKGVHEVFEAMRSRISAISLVHERLYRATFHEALDFGEYITELANGVGSLYAQDGAMTAVDIRAAGVEVPVDFCVDFGLVLNELMTNAFKHGIIPRGSGTVSVGLLRKEPGALVLSVADTGNGFPEAGPEGSGKSLGLTIVRSILPKYGATLCTANRGGAVAEVVIPWIA